MLAPAPEQRSRSLLMDKKNFALGALLLVAAFAILIFGPKPVPPAPPAPAAAPAPAAPAAPEAPAAG